MKKTILLLFSLVFISLGSSFAQNAAQASMHFYMQHHSFYDTDTVIIVQLQYNRSDDTAPVDSIYHGHRNISKKLTNDWPKEFYSASPIYAPYQKLMFIINGDTSYSEIFTYTGSHGVYRVDFAKEGIFVKNITPTIFRSDAPYSFYRTSIISLLIEIIGLWLVLLVLNYPDKKRFIIAVLLANIITLPIQGFLIPLLPALPGFIIGGIFVIVLEAAIVWYFTKKAGTFGKMILLSFFLNFLSLLAGGAFLFLYSMSGETMNAWFM